MTLDGPYIQQHQLPSDLPVRLMGKLLLWRLGIIAAAAGIVMLLLGLVLSVLLWPTLLSIISVLAAVGAFLVYEMERRRSRPNIRLVASFKNVQEECASVVSGAKHYIISVGGVESPELLCDIENRLAEEDGLRHIRLLVPGGCSAYVHDFLSRESLIRIPNLDLRGGLDPKPSGRFYNREGSDLMICANEQKLVLTMKGGRSHRPLAFVVSDRLLIDELYRRFLEDFEANLTVPSAEE